MAFYRYDSTAKPEDVHSWVAVSNQVKHDDERYSVRQEVANTIATVLQCEQLLVLTGLGTSLCVREGEKSKFPTMGDLWAQIENETEARAKAAKSAANDVDEFKNICSSVGYASGQNIEDLLSRCQMKLELEGEESQPALLRFKTESEKIIQQACKQDLTAEDTTTHEAFLLRMLQRSPRKARAHLFTTNYDLCFESAAARRGITFIDGFSFALPQRFQPEAFDYDIITQSTFESDQVFLPKLLRYYKLHGSVDWEVRDGVVWKNADAEQPLLIYPQAGKYAASYSPPFLELMSRFQWLLRQRNLGLLIIGCGLNDLHISEPLLAAIKSNPSIRAIVVSPDLCPLDAARMYIKGDERSAGAVAFNPKLSQISQMIENGDGRLSLINATFPEFISLMPTVQAVSSRDQHEERIQALEKASKAAEGGGA